MRLRSAVILANKLFAFEWSSSSIKNVTVDTELGIFKSDINLSLSLLKKFENGDREWMGECGWMGKDGSFHISDIAVSEI